MNLLNNPGWINKKLLGYQRLEDVPEEALADIRTLAARATSEDPVVSVIIAAWNEELNIIRCLDSLVRNKSSFPFEIIVINNNSTDRTQQVLDRIGVRNFLQPLQGVGPSRELGQQMAKGKYILSADADCVYPEKWIELMTRPLTQEGVVFVYGRFSYISDDDYPRWKLFLFEQARNVMSEFRHVKRPHLNTYGISLGYVRELGLKVGHLDKNMRGFDGRLCFDMMKFGKVVAVRSPEAKAWTGTRALERDGDFFTAVTKRVLREIARLEDYFTPAKEHNTKESGNRDYSIRNSIDTIKRKLNPFGSRKS